MNNITNVKKYLLPVAFWILFESIAVILWRVKNNIFFLFNFSYIGTSLTIALLLFVKKKKNYRRVSQIAIGLYMFVYLGIISNENMQIEGFWYYLFLGVFQAAVIHYFVAKIFGPVIFGRGWCGYACWTGMVLEFLPYKKPVNTRKKIGFIRYIVFVLSIIYVGSLFLFKVNNIEKVMLWSFIAGNIIYYILGIVLAFVFKDNRAFCKYICPITVFLKPFSYFALLRVKNDKDKCISCNKCRKVCPMNVDMRDNSRKRKNGTECILCMNCINECPKNALHF